MGNGFPIACVVGRTDVMKIFEEIFFSFTFGGEVASMAAALKVLDVLEHTDALERMEAQGRVLQDGFNALAKWLACRNAWYAWASDLVTTQVSRRRRKGQLVAAQLVSQEMVKRGS